MLRDQGVEISNDCCEFGNNKSTEPVVGKASPPVAVPECDLVVRGRVDDSSFFEYLSPFCSLSIELHCTFSISYKILAYSSVSSTVFPKGSVTVCDFSLGGGWMIFHFRLFKSILFFVN